MVFRPPLRVRRPKTNYTLRYFRKLPDLKSQETDSANWGLKSRMPGRLKYFRGIILRLTCNGVKEYFQQRGLTEFLYLVALLYFDAKWNILASTGHEQKICQKSRRVASRL